MRKNGKELLYEVYYANMELLENIAKKRLADIPEMSHYESVNGLLDNIMIASKETFFNSDNHALNYLKKALNKNINREKKIFHLENIPKLTFDEREYWFQFTRDFFDKQSKLRADRIGDLQGIY